MKQLQQSHVDCSHALLSIPTKIDSNIDSLGGTGERFSSEENSDDDKLRRHSSETKTSPGERLRPIGASAEDAVRESEDSKLQDGGLERPVHIVIKPQKEEGTERRDSQVPSQCLPPIM